MVHPAWYVRALITVIKPFIRWAHIHFHSVNRDQDVTSKINGLSALTLFFSLSVRSLAGRCASSTACRNWLSLFLWSSCKSQNASESESRWSTAAHVLIVIQHLGRGVNSPQIWGSKKVFLFLGSPGPTSWVNSCRFVKAQVNVWCNSSLRLHYIIVICPKV